MQAGEEGREHARRAVHPQAGDVEPTPPAKRARVHTPPTSSIEQREDVEATAQTEPPLATTPPIERPDSTALDGPATGRTVAGQDGEGLVVVRLNIVVAGAAPVVDAGAQTEPVPGLLPLSLLGHPQASALSQVALHERPHPPHHAKGSSLVPVPEDGRPLVPHPAAAAAAPLLATRPTSPPCGAVPPPLRGPQPGDAATTPSRRHPGLALVTPMAPPPLAPAALRVSAEPLVPGAASPTRQLNAAVLDGPSAAGDQARQAMSSTTHRPLLLVHGPGEGPRGEAPPLAPGVPPSSAQLLAAEQRLEADVEELLMDVLQLLDREERLEEAALEEGAQEEARPVSYEVAMADLAGAIERLRAARRAAAVAAHDETMANEAPRVLQAVEASAAELQEPDLSVQDFAHGQALALMHRLAGACDVCMTLQDRFDGDLEALGREVQALDARVRQCSEHAGGQRAAAQQQAAAQLAGLRAEADEQVAGVSAQLRAMHRESVRLPQAVQQAIVQAAQALGGGSTDEAK